jgi:hypothetical protein
LADFAFDAAAPEDVLPVDDADCLRTLEVAVEGFADLADAVFAGGTFAAGVFFTEADGASAGGFFAAVFFAAGDFEVVPEPAAAEDCADGSRAAKLFPGHSRQVKTAATQYEVFLSSIRLRSNHRLSGESRRAGAFLYCIPI